MRSYFLLLGCLFALLSTSRAQQPAHESVQHQIELWQLQIDGNLAMHQLSDDDWTEAKLESGRERYEVEVQKSDALPGAIRMEFDKEAFYQRKRNFYLRPVTEDVMLEVYSHTLAEFAGVRTTGWQLVNLVVNGEQAGLFMLNEKPDEYFMERHGIAGLEARVFMDSQTSAEDVVKLKGKEFREPFREAIISGIAAQKEATCLPFELDQFAALCLLREIAGFHPLPGKVDGYYRTTNGLFEPVYQPEANRLPASDANSTFNYLLGDAGFLDAYLKTATKLQSQEQEIRTRLNAVQQQLNGLAATHPFRVPDPKDIADKAVKPRKYEAGNSGKVKLPCVDNQALIKRWEKLGFTRKGNELRLSSKIKLPKSEDAYIFPANCTVFLDPGAELILAEGVSVVSYSPVVAKGNTANPVRIHAAKPEKPFGTFIVVGDGSQAITLEHVEVSGGSDGVIDGLFCPGAFGIFHADAHVANCVFSDNKADDALNVKYGKVRIAECRFEENEADELDLDFCTGTVQECAFLKRKGDSNGDGLDLSGSLVSVVQCSFTGYKDKGISVGEASEILIAYCDFIDNNIGIAAKDLSTVVSYQNRFDSNSFAYSAYRKKQVFGGAEIQIFKDSVVNSKSESQVDAFSSTMMVRAIKREFLLQFEPLPANPR